MDLLKRSILSPYHHLNLIISFFLLKPIFTTLLDASEDFSDEEDKAIHRRNSNKSKIKRKPRGISNNMLNEQKEQISAEDYKTTDSGDCPICGEVDLCLLIIFQIPYFLI